MTQIKRAVEFRFSNERGQVLFNCGEIYRAFAHFVGVASEQKDNDQHVIALQKAGVCLLHIGQYDEAVAYLNKAKDLLPLGSYGPRLTAEVHRDLGAALNKLGLVQKSREILGEALSEFDRSVQIMTNPVITADLPVTEHIERLSEERFTRALRDLLIFEMGSKPDAIRSLMTLNEGLLFMGKEVDTYDLDVLLCLVRVLPFHRRWAYLKSALYMTSKASKSSSSRKQVWLALLGNKVYRMFE